MAQRVSQITLEVLSKSNGNARVSQATLEVLTKSPGSARASQVYMEALTDIPSGNTAIGVGKLSAFAASGALVPTPMTASGGGTLGALQASGAILLLDPHAAVAMPLVPRVQASGVAIGTGSSATGVVTVLVICMA